MCFQIACLKRWKVTVVALVCFFARVLFQMFFQIACPGRSVVTLVAFVWFFSRVSFKMCLQMAFLKRCIITLVAFVQFLSSSLCHTFYTSFRRGSVHCGNGLLTAWLNYMAVGVLWEVKLLLYQVHIPDWAFRKDWTMKRKIELECNQRKFRLFTGFKTSRFISRLRKFHPLRVLLWTIF